MRDRMVELIKTAPYGSETLGEYFNTSYIENCIVEHLLANGVIVPPCKVGDAVWYVIEEEGEIIMDIVEAVYVNQYSNTCLELKMPSYVQGMMCKKIPFECFGKTVFLTKEEAERALRGEGK